MSYLVLAAILALSGAGVDGWTFTNKIQSSDLSSDSIGLNDGNSGWNLHSSPSEISDYNPSVIIDPPYYNSEGLDGSQSSSIISEPSYPDSGTLIISEGDSTDNCPEANGWVSRDGECYLFSDSNQYYERALRMCHNHAATLYSPSSADDLSWLLSQWRDKRSYDQSMAWIGCSDRRNEGTWECDGIDFDFVDWGNGEPSADPQQHCMVTFINPGWAGYGQEYDNECSLYELPFICKAGCPDKPNWVSDNGNCYYFSSKGLSYSDAEEYCHIRGLKLFSPNNEDEQQFLLENFVTYGGAYSMAYIGCNDRETQGYWTCDDGHGAAFNFFGAGDPSHASGEDCIVTFINSGWLGYGDWWDNPCDTELPFVCSYW